MSQSLQPADATQPSRPVRRRVARATVAGTMLLAGIAGPGVVTAQPFADVAPQPIRVEWSADPARGKWQAVCGYIYNDGVQSTREIRLLVEGRDATDRVVDARRSSVLGYIPPRGRSYFCSTAAAGAARYLVTVDAVQWGGER